MKRTAPIALAIVLGLIGANRLVAGRDPVVNGVTATVVATSPVGPHRDPVSGEWLPSVPGPTAIDAELTAVASRWVVALWSRQPGEAPFGWLDRVADITAPELDAELRSARSTLSDRAITSATVDVYGVYPDAQDSSTLTVVCVAHRITAAGRHDEPCTTTVTIAPAPSGRLVVVAVR
jgi:hypothetical protein